jgi:hypothetical protein
MEFSNPGFIKDFVPKLPHPFDTDWFSMLLITLDSEEKIGNQACKHLDHQLGR